MTDIWDMLEVATAFQQHFDAKVPTVQELLDDHDLLSEFLNQNQKLFNFITREFYSILILKLTTLYNQDNLQQLNKHAFIACQLLQIKSNSIQHYLLTEQPPLVFQLLEYFDKPCEHYLLDIYVSRVLVAILQNYTSRALIWQRFYKKVDEILDRGVIHATNFIENLLFGKEKWPSPPVIHQRNEVLRKLIHRNELSLFDKFFQNWISIDQWKSILQLLIEPSALEHYQKQLDSLVLRNSSFFCSVIQLLITCEARSVQDEEYRIQNRLFWQFCKLLVQASFLQIAAVPKAPDCLSLLSIIRHAIHCPTLVTYYQEEKYFEILLFLFPKYPSHNILHSHFTYILEKIAFSHDSFKNALRNTLQAIQTFYQHALWKSSVYSLTQNLIAKKVLEPDQGMCWPSYSKWIQKISTEIGWKVSVQQSPRKLIVFDQELLKAQSKQVDARPREEEEKKIEGLSVVISSTQFFNSLPTANQAANTWTSESPVRVSSEDWKF